MNATTLNYLPHVFVALAAVTTHFSSRRVVFASLALALGLGLWTGGIAIEGAGLLISLALLLRLATESDHRSVRWTAGPVAFILAVALSDYALPGFRNTIVFDHYQFTPAARPFTMYFNFDKTMSGVLLALFVLGHRRLVRLSRAHLILAAKILTALVLAILPAAVWSGYVGFEPKWPAGAAWWYFNNLVFVCLAEETLYRGCILEMLLRLRAGVRSKIRARAWTVVALGLSSVAFGLAHYRGGVANVGLATFAGLFYGYAYVRTRRIHASMLIHFGLNLIHFVLFTYPANKG